MFCLLIFAPVVAEGQVTNDKSRASLEEHLKSLVRQWDEAIVKRDTATLDRLLADEFEFVGGVKKAAYLDSIKTQAADAVTSAVSTDLQVLVYDNTAVVTGLDTMSGQSGCVGIGSGRVGPDMFLTRLKLCPPMAPGEGQPYTARWLYTDVWVKRAGRWQCVRTHASAR